MTALPDDLRAALDAETRRFPQRDLARAVDHLITRYREGRPAERAILRDQLDVTAYAAYRMPATYAAVRSALAHTAARTPDFSPRRMIDIGGGTGAAVWAATELWPSLDELTVIEQAQAAVTLGRRLTESATSAALRRTHWHRSLIDITFPPPKADLVTLSYVLGELPESVRGPVTSWLARDAGLLLIIEPGTPAGYLRVAEARRQLLDEGHRVIAPCPHQDACPIHGGDWCHFAARLPRQGSHRRLKEATRGFEDEKFSYLAVGTAPVPDSPGSRVLRHPHKRKGLVSLTLCTPDAALRTTTVSKSHGAAYRTARSAGWGDSWEPGD